VAATLVGCSDEPSRSGETLGKAEIELTNAPSDVQCLRLTVSGPSRTDVRKFPLVTGQRAVYRLDGLPVGKDTFTADAFNAACETLKSGTPATWYSEPVVANVRAGVLTHVALKMIHNGRVSVGVDFGDGNGPSGQDDPPLEGGVRSSDPPYLSPLGCPADVRAILTAGDRTNKTPDGAEYGMVGIPDGLGAFDNGDGTFTLLVNHGLGATSGVPRAHGAPGAFVSKWTIRKADLAVLEGSDLIRQVAVWNAKTSSYERPTTGIAFGRFGSGDLPKLPALFDAASELGFDGRLFFNGEGVGTEGRAFAHALDGTSVELPRLGKASWENIVLNPGTGARTVSIGLDSSGNGQLYVYAGEKSRDGDPIQRAGLTNGALYGVSVSGTPVENAQGGIPDAPFELVSFGNVENRTGAELEAASVQGGVTGFQQPEDGAWDPNDPNDFYFVTTAAFEVPSRLYRLRFADAREPQRGGRIQMLLDGTEGQRMLDNVAIDTTGHVYLQEDPGNNPYLAKIWRYDVAADQLSEIAQHSAAGFSPGAPGFLTQDEESSGIIDASDVLGPNTFLLTTQAHFQSPDSEVVEGGQLAVMRDNDAVGGVMAALATLMVECTGKIGPDSFVLQQDGTLGLPPNFACTLPSRDGEDDRMGALQAYLSLQDPRREGIVRKIMPNARECIGGRWASWRQSFARTGITQEQCPAWRRTRVDDPTGDRLDERRRVLAAKDPAKEPGTYGAEPPDTELFKFFREFEVGFDQGSPNHECAKNGPAGCAAMCGGAFPGFVVGGAGTAMTVDAFEWLEHSTYPVNGDPWLSPGYYHPTWSYYYGPSLASRMRANTCNYTAGPLDPSCQQPIAPGNVGEGELRSCSAVSNCASEICSVWLDDGLFQASRYTLNCIGNIASPDAAIRQAAWNTCVAVCDLPAVYTGAL
jgi:hypothetical protein